MFKSRKFLVIFCPIILLVSIISLSLLLPQIWNSNQFTATESPDILYNAAAEKLLNIRNAEMVIQTQEIIKTKENTLSSTSTKNVTHIDWGLDTWNFSAAEFTDIGQHILKTSAIYSDQILYYTLNDVNFAAPYNQQDLSGEYPPAIILDPSLYKKVAGIQVGSSNLILFCEPTQQEEWATVPTTTFLDARGTAWISNKGELTKSSYAFCYKQDEFTYYKSVTVQIVSQNPDLITPPDIENYLALDDPLLPTLLETACGYLLQAQNIESNYVNQITCEIFGDTRLQNIDIAIKSRNADPYIEMTTAVDITNSSRGGEIISSNQIQTYSNGNYSLQSSDAPTVTTEGASSQELLKSCQETLIGTILLPQHIKNAKVRESGDVLRVEFTATDDFAQKVISDACSALYNDPLLLDQLSPEHHINSVICYIEFSTKSGLPIKSGIHFLGTYYSSDLPYQLIFKSDQAYHIP